jgi:hypothetical protein
VFAFCLALLAGNALAYERVVVLEESYSEG